MKINNFTKYSFVLVLTFILFLSSCDDYLTKEIEFGEIGYKPQMVLNSRIENGSDSLLISVAQNINYAETVARKVDLIDDVNIILTVDGEAPLTAKTLAEDYTGPDSSQFFNYWIDIAGIDFSQKNIGITASHPGFDNVKSDIYLPARPLEVEGKLLDGTTSRIIFAFTGDFRNASIDFQDAANEKNYYYFKFGHAPYRDTFIYDTGMGLDSIDYEVGDFPLFIQSDEPGMIDLDSYALLLADDLFDGQKKSIDLYAFDFEGGKVYDSLYLEVVSLSESEFLFRQSLSRYQSSQDFGFFSEPTTLLSNIENGLGIFAADDSYKFEFY